LANYGAYVFTDVAIASSGPPFMELTSGCLDPFTNSGYGYANPAAAMVDGAFGFNDSLVAGPCQNHDSSYTSYWNANGNENGLIYKYPNTRVAVIAGGRDNGMIVLRAQDYYQLLLRNGQSMLSYQLVPTMGHRIMVSQDGLNALYAEITQ